MKIEIQHTQQTKKQPLIQHYLLLNTLLLLSFLLNLLPLRFQNLRIQSGLQIHQEFLKVEAARRYRDKKKAEQNGVEFEEEALVARNKELKSQVSELEAEMKTMKKLMKELGILK